MFRALLCASSRARDYDVVYHIGRFVLGLLYVGDYVRLGWSSVRVAGSSIGRVVLGLLYAGHYSSLPAPYLQHTTNQER
jgi:hypothetical protein